MVLWKKESNSTDACYIDLLMTEAEKEHLRGGIMKLMRVVACKSDDKSTWLRKYGNKRFKAYNWLEAMELYNESLRYAPSGSENISLAYANRSACFLLMKKYEECLVDIELAKKANYPQRLMPKLDLRRAICMKLLKDKPNKPEEKVGPTLNFDADEKFPGLANALEIRNNNEMGNYVVAKRDIGVGQIIMVDEMFVSNTYVEDQTFCKICLKTRKNFIPCENCSDAMFCDDRCMATNNIHKIVCCALRCQTFHFVRMIESILIGVTTFPNAGSFMEFVERALATRDIDTPNCSTDVQKRYGMFLKMNFSSEEMNDDLKIIIFWSYHLLMKIPEIKERFRSTHEKRFLMHLILQHGYIFQSAETLFYDFNIQTEATYLEISCLFSFQTMIKHSCIQNVTIERYENQVFVYTVRPIEKGEQLFIENKKPKSDAAQCKCSKCVPVGWKKQDEIRLSTEPDYRFIVLSGVTDYDNPEKRLVLKSKLIKLLQKYGRLPWSQKIEYLVSFLDYCMQKEF